MGSARELPPTAEAVIVVALAPCRTVQMGASRLVWHCQLGPSERPDEACELRDKVHQAVGEVVADPPLRVQECHARLGPPEDQGEREGEPEQRVDVRPVHYNTSRKLFR